MGVESLLCLIQVGFCRRKRSPGADLRVAVILPCVLYTGDVDHPIG